MLLIEVEGEAIVDMSSPEARMTAFTSAPVGLKVLAGTALPVDESFVGTMVTVPLPQAFGSTMEDASRLRDRLLFEHKIELQVQAEHGVVAIRVSAQIYNERADVERLAGVLATLAD